MDSLEFSYESMAFRFQHSNPKDHIFAQMNHTRTFYEIDLLETLRQFISPDDVVLDVGANIGTHSVFFAGVCHANVKAFEPNPVTFDLLNRNIEANGLSKRLECHQVGVGEHASRAEISQPLADNLGSSCLTQGSGPIEIEALDSIGFQTPPRLIKIDVEGMEEDVLRGGMDLIQTSSPIIVAEIRSEAQLARIRRLLEPIGYYSADSLNHTPTLIFRPTKSIKTPERTFEIVSRFLPRLNQLRQSLLEDASKSRTLVETVRQTHAKTLSDIIVALDGFQSTKNAQDEISTTLPKISEGIESLASLFEQAEQDKSADFKHELEAIKTALLEIHQGLSTADTELSLPEQLIKHAEALKAAVESSQASTIDQFQKQIASLATNLLAEMASFFEESDAAATMTLGDVRSDVARTDDKLDNISVSLNTEIEGLQAKTSRLSEDVKLHVDQSEARLSDWLKRSTEDQRYFAQDLLSSQDEALSRVTDILGAVTAKQELLIQSEKKEETDRSPLRAVSFYAHEFRNGWATWRQDQKVRLQENGLFTVADQYTSTPGVKSGHLDMPGPGLYHVALHCVSPVSESDGWFVRVKDAVSDELLGPDVPITDTTCLVRFYNPRRIVKARICVLTKHPKPGQSIHLREVHLEKLDEETIFEEYRANSETPVIASLASIPSRREMLFDAVRSLLPQCDEVRVFLNGYADIPDFLDHPRISVRRSQDYDDVGDAGKFAWIEDEDPPGYRIICDDDLLYPPDVVRRLVAATRERNDEAMIGLHGVLVRQPVSRYYSPESRHAVHFQSALAQPKPVHVLATCIICAHSSCLPTTRRSFMFRNMADVWLMRHAQQNNIPLIVLDRPRFWIRENKQNARYDTIYANSIQRSGTSFDSSRIQDNVLSNCQPFSLRSMDRPVALLVVLVTSGRQLECILENLHKTRGSSHEIKVVLVLVDADDDLQQAAKSVPFWFELHLIDVTDTTSAWDAIRKLSASLSYDIGFLLDDLTEFTGSGWLTESVILLEESQDDFMSFHQRKSDEWQPTEAGRLTHFALFKTLFPETGRLQANERKSSTVARFLETALLRNAASRTPALKPVFPSEETVNRSPSKSHQTLRTFFDRCVVLNLDRRPDRWRKITSQLQQIGISAVRQRATDGLWPNIHGQYRQYAVSPLRETSAAVPRLETEKQFYLDAISEAQRVTYLEQKSGRKAIASAGAWGYLLGLIEILENAISDKVEHLLFLDDDVLFHKQSASIFENAISDLSRNWKILQLGTLQYNWSPQWIRWRGPHLYSQLGSAVGSHALGLHHSVFPFLLDHAKRMEMPFDIGPLSAAVRCFPEDNFVIYPNIAIQQLSDSNIGTSSFVSDNELTEIHKRYRWSYKDYCLNKSKSRWY